MDTTGKQGGQPGPAGPWRNEQHDDEAPPTDLPAVLTPAEAVRRGYRRVPRAGFAPAGPAVHVVAGVDRQHPDLRAAVAMAGRHEAFTLGGWAAARMIEQEALRRGGVPTEEVFDGGGPGGVEPVLLLAPPRTRLRPRSGVRLLRSRVPASERVRADGFWRTDARRTAFDLARLRPFTEAVVAVDRLVALGACTIADLDGLVRARSRWLGVAAARRVVAAAAVGVESPQETRVRLLWLAAGLPVPLCNPRIVDRSGRFLARVDLLEPASGLVVEYDGAVHADAGRRASDAARQERLVAAGLTVVRATVTDLATASARARWQTRLRAAHRAAVRARPPAPDHLGWNILPDTPGVSWQDVPL